MFATQVAASQCVDSRESSDRSLTSTGSVSGKEISCNATEFGCRHACASARTAASQTSDKPPPATSRSVCSTVLFPGNSLRKRLSARSEPKHRSDCLVNKGSPSRLMASTRDVSEALVIIRARAFGCKARFANAHDACRETAIVDEPSNSKSRTMLSPTDASVRACCWCAERVARAHAASSFAAACGFRACAKIVRSPEGALKMYGAVFASEASRHTNQPACVLAR
mmetsp:Transcript_37595/g.87903  ORF Transcript_37595/g.87903 Transcript_37595/m.87903 type:complete len:226 (+) Transcript_37595:514-1191(+)